MSWTDKQKELLDNLNHRYCLCFGATRSGKTYMQYFLIPKMIRKLKDKEGLVVILGNTKGTVQRNIIEPLMAMWSPKLVSSVNSQNKAMLFGEEVHVLGCDKVSSVDKLRGSSIKLAFGDECTTWNEEVFEMLKSRLDKSYSQFFGTANPTYKKHFLKADFIDVADERGIDLFAQQYSLDDNPYCDIAEDLKREYTGVFYERYVLGNWCNSEGIIFDIIAKNPEQFKIKKEELPPLEDVWIAGDFGKSKSDTAFVATGFYKGKVYSLLSKKYKMTGKTYLELEADFADFLTLYNNLYDKKPSQVWLDSAEPTYINSFRKSFPQYNIRGSIKREILERIRATNILLATGKMFFVDKYTEPLIEALCEAVWDETKAEDVRLDDGTSDIDTLDAFEYSFEYKIHQLVRL